MTHTKGPWDYAHSKIDDEWHVFQHDGTAEHIATVQGDKEQRAANARLIASAPDMYEDGRVLVRALNKHEIGLSLETLEAIANFAQYISR